MNPRPFTFNEPVSLPETSGFPSGVFDITEGPAGQFSIVFRPITSGHVVIRTSDGARGYLLRTMNSRFQEFRDLGKATIYTEDVIVIPGPDDPKDDQLISMWGPGDWELESRPGMMSKPKDA